MSTDSSNDRLQGTTAPSPQDAQAMLEQLRSAPAEEILTEVLSTLLSTAQVKLGRRDARLLIDLSAVLIDHAHDVVSDDLRAQVDAALGQLRMGQVAAEREVATGDQPEPNDLAHTPPPRADDSRPSAGPEEPPGSSSGLWVPGR